ncbi:MAG TPA: hypothetical protein VFL91_06380 [Thermomicrobiales bacterium]|nr:hypothetical protein [Thermomicrobiales bacterium]
MSLTVADLFERDVRERAATRVFDAKAGRSYVCEDGYCVVGALLREAGHPGPPTPDLTAAAACYVNSGAPHARIGYTEAMAVFADLIRANDRAGLATPAAVRRALMLEGS